MVKEKIVSTFYLFTSPELALIILDSLAEKDS